MKRALFNKELRSLRPFMFVILALVLLSASDIFLVPFGTSFRIRLESLALELAVLQIVFAFALGSNLLVREIDDGTLNFLDGLPVTRSAVFMAKIEAAMLVLVTMPLGLLLPSVAVHLATRESLNYALHPSLLLTFFALSILVTAVSLTAGMLMGSLRYLAWLVIVLCAIGVKLLEDWAPELSAALNTANLLSLRFVGNSWQLPLPTIWTQLGLTSLFGVSAFGLFLSSGRVRAQAQRLSMPRRVLTGSLVTIMVIAAVGGTGTLIERSNRETGGTGSDGADAVIFTPIAAGHATTKHYTFSYPALSSERVLPLIASADQVFAAVAALLTIDGGAPIDVDLAGAAENHDGSAYLDRIRMRARGAGSVGTLAHETTHVFAARLAGGELGRNLQGMTVFNEGLAEWVESKIVSHKGVTEGHELAAAVVSARRLVTPRQLTAYDAFESAVDGNLKYSLGAVFVDRFVARYGPAAPKTLLLVLASEAFPRDLKGYSLWQTAFQLAGFDLDLVLDDYAHHLRQLEPKFASQIAQWPRLRGSLLERDDVYAVKLRFDLPVPANAYPLVRFRPGMSGKTSQYRIRYSAVSPAGEFAADVPRGMVTRGEICFQPGLKYEGITIYEPWVCLAASSASQG